MKDVNTECVKSALSLSEETNGGGCQADNDDDDEIQIISESAPSKPKAASGVKIEDVNGYSHEIWPNVSIERKDRKPTQFDLLPADYQFVEDDDEMQVVFQRDSLDDEKILQNGKRLYFRSQAEMDAAFDRLEGIERSQEIPLPFRHAEQSTSESHTGFTENTKNGCDSDSEVVFTLALDGDPDSDVEVITAVIENVDQEDESKSIVVMREESELAKTPEKVNTVTETEEESPQRIFVRNFAEISERDSDEDDVVVLGHDTAPSTSAKMFSQSKVKSSNETDRSSVKTYRAQPKNPIKTIADLATFDDTLSSLDMVVNGHPDVTFVDTFQSESFQHANARRSVLRLTKALSITDEASYAPGMTHLAQQQGNMQLPSYSYTQVQNSAQMPRGVNPGTPLQMRPMQINAASPVARPSVPNVVIGNVTTQMSNLPMGSNYTLRGNGSTISPPTMTTSSTTSAPRLSSNIVNNVQPINQPINVQQLAQLIYDPQTGLLMYPQLLGSPQSAPIMQPRGVSPNQTYRLQNGLVLQPTSTAQLSFTAPRTITPNARAEMSVMKQTNIVSTPQGLQIQSPVRMNSPIRGPLQANMTRSPLQTMNRTPLLTRPTPPQNTRPPAPYVRPGNSYLPGVPMGAVPRHTAPLPNNRPMLLPARPPPPVVNNIGAKPPSTTTPIQAQILKANQQGGNKNSMPGVTAGNQKPLPGTVEEKESETPNKTFPSLVVHVKVCLRGKPNKDKHTKARTDLDAKVKSVLVQSPAKFTEWLLRRGTLKLEHFCNVHKAILGNGAAYQLGMYADGNREPFSGGYIWSADCCKDKKLSVFHSSIFEGSKYPPGTVLKVLYHWSCQTPTQSILQWVKVSSVFVKNFFTLLRAGCTAYLHEYCPPLGGEFKHVEIGVITLGSSAETARGVKNVNVEILGVFDPATKIIRMKVINSFQGLFKEKGSRNVASEQGARAFQILWPLTHWVDKRSILLVDGIIDNQLFHELGFTNLQQCGDDPNVSPSNSNVMNYLRHVVPKMFSSTLSVLSKSIVQQFLDELSWREAYGQNAYQCFDSMLDHIEQMTKWNLPETLNARLNKIYQNPFVDWSYSKQSQRTPLNSIPMSLRNEPGIRECIRHVMKDEHERKTFATSGNSAPQVTTTIKQLPNDPGGNKGMKNVPSTAAQIAGPMQNIPVAHLLASLQNVPALQLLKPLPNSPAPVPSRNVPHTYIPTARNAAGAVPPLATSRSGPPAQPNSGSQLTPPNVAPTASALYAANLQAKAILAKANLAKRQEQRVVPSKSSYLSFLGRPQTIDIAMYYYGRCVAGQHKSWSAQKFLGTQKCPMCTRVFRSNYDVIRHIATHISPAGRVNETSLCTYCLRELPGNIGMVQHIESAHKLSGCKYGCRICEQRFISQDDLVIHMWSTHIHAEAPYVCEVCDFVSSFRQEIVQHFYDAHNGISFVMCPFCLKILSVETASFLKTLVLHMQGHWQKRGKRCTRCLLTFTSDADLAKHMGAHGTRKGHLSWRTYCHPSGTTDALRMSTPPPNDLSTEMVVAPPSVAPPPKKLKLTQEPALVQRPKPPEIPAITLNSTFSVPLNTNAKFGGSKYHMDLSSIEPDVYKCIECHEDLRSPAHFIGRLQCTKCRFITSCQNAMNKHHEDNHIPGGSTQVKPVIHTRPIATLKKPLCCDCGYESKHAYRMAHHLVMCEKKTARPAPLSYEEEMAEIRQSASNASQPPRESTLTDVLQFKEGEVQQKRNDLSRVYNVNFNTELDNHLLNNLDADLTFSSSLEASLSLPPILSPAEPMPQSPLPLFDHTSPCSSATTSSSSSTSRNTFGSDINNTWDPADLWETALNGVTAKIT